MRRILQILKIVVLCSAVAVARVVAYLWGGGLVLEKL
jgi:hypothetical protein